MKSSIQQLRELMAKRSDTVKELTGNLDTLLSDNRYSDSHKADNAATIRAELANRRNEFDERIKAEIAGKRHLLSKFYHEKGELDTAGEIRALRQLMENDKLARDLLKEYEPPKGANKPGMASVADVQLQGLWREANHLVALKSPEAGAYVDALKELTGRNNEAWQTLNAKYADSRLTEEQISIRGVLAELDETERKHNITMLLEEYADTATTNSKHIQIKMALHRLGVNVNT